MARSSSDPPITAIAALAAGLFVARVAIAAQPESVVVVSVEPQGYLVDGRPAPTPADLTRELRSRKAKLVDLRPRSDSSYETVETAVRAIRDAGARLPIRGSRQDK